MDIARINREFADAQQRFALVELRPTTDGKVYARTALQTVAGKNYVLSIKFTDSYPNAAPRIYATQVAPNAPERWPDGSLSIFGATVAWNVKTHDASYALSLARVWLKQYAKWRKTGEWPERTDTR